MNLGRRISAWAMAATLLWMTACGGLGTSPSSATGGSGTGGTPQPPKPAGSINNINHIVFMLMENRSFDHYFGKMNDYRQAHNIPGTVDGLPDNVPSETGWNGRQVDMVHMHSACSENLTPNWQEAHAMYNLDDQNYPTVKNPTKDDPPLNGFAAMAGGYSLHTGGSDISGQRAMAYYNGDDLPYHYFLGANFAMSDRWFAPISARTGPNRDYALAATSHGHAYPPKTGLPVKTIFDLLDDAKITWRVYVTLGFTYLQDFDGFGNLNRQGQIVDISQYYTDLKNGTLAQVSYIETEGNDEHPDPGADIQSSAAWSKQVIDAFMQSSAWKDGVFFLTFDEWGGFYDHVAPYFTVNPDDISPNDMPRGDPGPDTDNFDRTGFRIPMVVISPYAKKNYVSHTNADNTAILKFIETRFNLPNLTKRDAAQIDMTEFFDWNNPAWMTPPTTPDQPIDLPCYWTSVP